jgi:hypothetical protein
VISNKNQQSFIGDHSRQSLVKNSGVKLAKEKIPHYNDTGNNT